MIEAQDLCRRYGAVTAVDRISFRIEPGEVVGLLGVNGAGKTTTIRMLTGFLPASSGSVRVAGFDVLRESLEVRRRVGYLPETVPLYRELRLCEMLDFQGRLHGLARAERKRRSAEVLEQVGLTERARSLIGSLSKGMRQRAGLAVALLPDPEVVILDEPTSGLDPLQRREVRDLVRALSTRRTVLFSSHVLAEVEAICRRVIIVHRGRIAADGTPDELVAKHGGRTHVRAEAVVGHDVATALRLLGKLPGVRHVRDGGRLGIHHVFELDCGEDLREDVGALAAARGWALRELSFRRPSLEELFARIALELGDTADVPGETLLAAPASAPMVPDPGGFVPLTPSPHAPAQLPPAPPPRAPAPTVSMLNPFRDAPPAEKPREGSGS